MRFFLQFIEALDRRFQGVSVRHQPHDLLHELGMPSLCAEFIRQQWNMGLGKFEAVPFNCTIRKRKEKKGKVKGQREKQGK